MRIVRNGLPINQRRLMRLVYIMVLLAFPEVLTQAADPGVPVPTTANASGIKPGSVLFFNLYSSNVVDTNGIEETEISLVNTGVDITVRLFLVNGATGAVRSEYFCLGPNQMVNLLASQLNPSVTGYAVAVAVDRVTGCPVSHNFLAGEAYVKLATGHRAKLNAVAVAANFSGLLASCNASATSATIAFDSSGAGYNRVPRALAVQSIPSRADGNDTLLVINRVGGKLGATAQTIGAISGLLSDDVANDLSFNSTFTSSQFKSSLRNNSFPPIELPFETFIPAGRSGWMRFWAQSDAGVLGAVLNLNPFDAFSAGAFSGGENLRALTLATSSSYTIPINPPNCTNRPVLSRLEPGMRGAGSPAFTLTVRGIGFTGSSTVRWNGAARATTFVSATELRATISAADTAVKGATSVTVVNSATGTPSNALIFSPVSSELAVDDGSIESSLGLNAGGTVSALNRLTPTIYPATLSAVAIYFGRFQHVSVGDSLTVLFANDPSGNANINGLSLAQTSVQIQSLDQFNVYNVPPLTITSGDFVVGMRITHGANVFPIAMDTSAPLQRRSYYSANGSAYTLIDDLRSDFASNFGIRARLGLPQTCGYAVTPAELSFRAGGGSGAVSVTTAQDCNWQAISNAAWITITSNGSTSGNGMVNYSVAANTSPTARNGTLSVGGQTVAVTQAGGDQIQNPVPSLASMNPSTVQAGNSGFTMTLAGTNFVTGAVIRWNGGDRPTIFASGTQLTATISAADVAATGTANVTVFNPGPGGGSSNVLLFNITSAVSVVSNVSAASFTGATLAAESIVAAFGTGLATRVLAASTVPLPTSLAGTTVEVRDIGGTARLAPLFFVAPNQINYLMPPGTAAGAASIKVTASDGKVAQGIAQIAVIAPGIFSANSSGQGVAAGVALRDKANGSQIYEPLAQFDAAQNGFVSLPLDLGVAGEQIYLILYGTGLRGRSALSAVRARIGGVEAQVFYAGAQNDFVGLDQLNVLVPSSLAGRGEVDVVVIVDNQPANTVRVRFK